MGQQMSTASFVRSGSAGASEPKITVAIPTFNRAHWLRESIESVLAQTYTNFRIIVADNASEDETPDVVKSFDDHRIAYVRWEQNIGSIPNINRLIGITETPYLVLLPDDDVLYPGYLGAAVELLDRFENVGVVHSAFDQIDEQSRVLGREDPVRCESKMGIERRDMALERLMVSACGCCFGSVAYRTDALAATGGFREEIGHFCDRDVWMQLALDWDFGYLAEPLAGQRAHAQAITALIASESGLEHEERETYRLHSEINFERRMTFLDKAALETRRREQLRALATLQVIVDCAHVGLPTAEVASRLVRLVREHPSVVSRPAFWRLIAAQCGGRRMRALVRKSVLHKYVPVRQGSRGVAPALDVREHAIRR
jgi:glycosyltransferase involved in cell wall biosynthesis